MRKPSEITDYENAVQNELNFWIECMRNPPGHIEKFDESEIRGVISRVARRVLDGLKDKQ